MLISVSVDDTVPIDVISTAVAGVLEGAGVTHGQADRAKIAVEGLVFDARQRPRVSVATSAVTVEVELRGDSAVVRVIDFRAPEVNVSASSAMPQALLADGVIDQFTFGSQGKDGNRAECQIRLGRNPGLAAESEGAPAGVAVRPPALRQDVERVDDDRVDLLEFRPARPDDAEAIVECVYRCYGYTYPTPAFYQPDAIARMMTDGSLHSCVAVEPEGAVVGHAAFIYSDAMGRTPEAGVLLVDPRYRGHRIAERLAELRRGIAIDARVPGFWLECVTNHPASQREVLSQGGTAVGLLVAVDPPDFAMSGFDHSADERMSLLPMIVPLTDHHAGTVHVPASLVEPLSRCADEAGLSRTIDDTVMQPNGLTVLRVRLDVPLAVAHILVDRIGPDAEERIHAEVDALVEAQPHSVHVDVPLFDPAAGWLLDRLLDHGYVWASWLPGAREEGDVLRVQQVNSAAVDGASIQCASDHGRWLCDWILDRWQLARDADDEAKR